MKHKLLLLLFLIVLASAYNPLNNFNQCTNALTTSISVFKGFNHASDNQKIDIIASFVIKFSSILRNCGLNTAAEQFDQQYPATCINDLDKAAKIAVRMVNETENQAKFALDLALLERLYKTKIQKQCRFIGSSQLNFKSGGVCLQSAYKLSLIIQDLEQKLQKGDYAKAYVDFQQFLDDLPDTLEACGQGSWADKIRKAFPASCLRSLNELGKQLLVFEHNYDHLEWLFKHWKDLQKNINSVRSACPAFK